ncbi:MAG: hypothetical protein HQK83_11200 [Fibrobacteria bacterium]|nr:hypothetical protein [Fibrobacteria bacterium]
MHKGQQGDVNYERVSSIPAEAQQVSPVNGRFILAEGEATGHAHAIADKIELFEKNGILYMRNDHPVSLVHEEHHSQTIEPGIWEITATHEYDYFTELVRLIED